MYKYKGTIAYKYNMFDTNIKSVQFSLLSDVKLGYDAVREKAIEQCQKALGLAQCIVEFEYKEENV
jgi:hypothetical protein